MLLFTCLISRAVHEETLPKIGTVSLQNALRRFFDRRGVSSTIRSDQGTNFVGAQNQKEDTISFSTLAQLAEARECRWTFNPPGASHFGGVWERKIGFIRRVLDAVFIQVGQRNLNRDEFDSFVQEAANKVNNTPLWEVSSDPEDPGLISPAMLLTLREDPNPPHLEHFSKDDLLVYGRTRWRRVQYLRGPVLDALADEQIDNLGVIEGNGKAHGEKSRKAI
ncbi:hypothetical protein HAZT_HAZT000504 [Hyalella azteca]|uniref:Integrase catalytic domain-containing protein n=1 Tax=Hyalella azteca TaxID=294128 RepID=A0A6A0GWW9_HYAAZ|nr:hypothetical protein HAZT_HAZT000504 [Hyalella azteca]